MLKWIGLGMGAALLAACNPVAQTGDARAQVDTFHERMDAGDIEAIWSDTAEEMRAATSREDFDRLLGAVSKSLGAVQQTSQVGFHVKSGLGGTLTTLQMNTQFSKGQGSETFLFKGSGEEMKLVGYNINSADMMSAMAQAYEKDGADPAEPSESIVIVPLED